MEVRNITRDQSMSFDPFLLDALNIKDPNAPKSKIVDKSGNALAKDTENVNKANWQKDILLTALDKLENSIQVDDKSHPLGGVQNAPIESFDEALIELKTLVESNFKEYAAVSQANLTPGDILYLFEDTYDFVV